MKKVLRWGVGLACIAYIAHFFYTNRADLDIAFRLRPHHLVGILLIYLFHFTIHALRFQIVLEKCGDRRVPFWPWYKLFVHARFLNNVLPQAGNIYRSVRLKADYGITYVRYITAHVAIAWMDTVLNFLIAGLVVLAVQPGLEIGWFRATHLLFLGSVAALTAPIAVEAFSRLSPLKFGFLARLHRKLAESLRITRESLGDARYLLKVALLVAAGFADMVAVFYLTFLSFGVRVPIPTLAIFFALYKLSVYFVITPGNLGIRELAYGLLSAQMDIGMAEGILASAMLRVLNFVVLLGLGLAMGGLTLLRKGELRVAAQLDPLGTEEPPAPTPSRNARSGDD